MPFIKIHNLATGEEIEREMNAEELAQWQQNRVKAETEAQAEAQAVAQTAAAKAAAEAKLVALGLTSDDLKALGL